MDSTVQPARNNSTLKLSEQLERYRLILKQLDSCQAALFDLGFLTERDKQRLESFIDDEKLRVMRALRAFGLYVDSATPAPTGIPSLDAARRVAAKSERAV